MPDAQFFPEYPLSRIRGAEYNPRSIDDEAKFALRLSLETLGVCKPIISSGSVIVAGHQRTAQLRAIGLKVAPVVLIKSVSIADEIRFNQVHNGTDLDTGDEAVRIGCSSVPPRQYEMQRVLAGNTRAKAAAVRAQICQLLTKYGNWGACVATMSGNVIHGSQYALACKVLDIPARVYRIEDIREQLARVMLSKQYGVFSYNHLKKCTYNQTNAQMFRLREGARSQQKSALYEKKIIPYLQSHRNARLLDFGCGQADYVKMLRSKGYHALGIEFFFRQGKMLDGSAVHTMIDQLCLSLRRHGLFDVVLADYVLNSIDSIEAESDVLTCLQALCRPGGRIYFTGRSVRTVEATLERTKSADYRRRIEFLDENGFSAIYRDGNWFYQKFHTLEQALALGTQYIGSNAKVQQVADCWQVEGTLTTDGREEEKEAALRREFNLMWPAGRTVGKAFQIVEAWKEASRCRHAA